MKTPLIPIIALCLIASVQLLTSCSKNAASKSNEASTETAAPIESVAPIESEALVESENAAEAVESTETLPPAENLAPIEPIAPVEPSVPEDSTVLNTAKLVNNAIGNTLSVGSYEAKIHKSVDTDIMGSKSSSVTDVVETVSDNKAIVEGTKAEYNIAFEHKYCYDGDWMYFNMHGNLFKKQVSFEEFSEEAGGITEIIAELPTEAFVNATVNEALVELELDEATMKKVYRDVIMKIMQNTVGNAIEKALVQNAKISISIENDLVKTFGLSFVLEYTVGNNRVAYTVNQEIEFVNLGCVTEVNLPDNLGDYTVMNWS